jgi:tRNA-dihydrouridine synthase B
VGKVGTTQYTQHTEKIMSHAAAPAFHIGSIPIYGDALLAPMAGFSDLPFRVICRELGSAMSYTACITDLAVVHGGERTDQISDFLDAERPVALQLLGSREDELLAAADKLMEQRPDIIDVNMGCPARRVVSGGRGAALLSDPALIGRLIRRLVASLPVPVTAKIRLGWDADSRNYIEVARALEDTGIALIAVHGRTRAQQYSGQADWSAIAEVKQAVSVPVLANGDVRTVEDIDRIRAETGCEGAMIGRGAIGNPWIFARRPLAEVTWPERLALIRRHVLWMSHYYGERLGVVLFRKHVVKYVQGLPSASQVRPTLLACETVGELFGALEAWRPEL